MRDIFRAWSETSEFQRKLERAKNIVQAALKKSKKPYVAFSGGKDSTCVLHLVLQFAPNITVWHWDYGKYMPRAFEREVIENARKIGARNIVVDSSRAYAYADKVFYKVFFGRVMPRLLREGYDAVFLGLRKEESVSRRERIKSDRSLTSIKEYWPIQDWSWRDVWAYIFANNLPYHSAYDRYIPILGWQNVRFTTFFDPEFDTFGSRNIDGMVLWRWKHG